MQESKSVEQFFGTAYRDYAIYVVESRALPHLMDGLKPAQRKILWAAVKSLKPGVKTNMSSLMGSTIMLSGYHHGDASLGDGIVRLASNYQSNCPPISIFGSDGSLRSPHAAAPRYLKVYLNKNAEIYLSDSELLEQRQDGEDMLEPKHFHPILPTVLASRTSGMAIGYGVSVPVSFSLKSIAQATMAVIAGKDDSEVDALLVPQVEGFNGEWRFDPESGRFTSASKYRVEKNILYIEDLPMETTYEAYDWHLRALLEKGYILGYENTTTDETPTYKLHLEPSKYDTIITRGGKPLFEKVFGLSQKHASPNLTFLVNGQDGSVKPHRFGSYVEVIRKHVEARFPLYQTRLDGMISRATARLNNASEAARFISAVLEDKLIINKRATVDILKDMKTMGFDKSLLQLPLSRLTADEIAKQLAVVSDCQSELEVLRSTTPHALRLADIQNYL